jgi:UDP-N-acetylmuramoyl-tripeptide--D-alanyl-D-alanine ligase
MTTLWNSVAVDQITSGNSTAPWSCQDISIDTRTLKRGDLFVALIGKNGDGHNFLEDAASKGAAAALVSENGKSSLPLLQVKDTLLALGQIGIAARERSSALRFAITGSVGKTSTKEMLRRVLSDQGRAHSNISSYNNHWGVPLTLARMPQDTEFGIFEAGMNNPGEIRPLSHMIKPHIALITTIGEAHAGAFASTEDLAKEKAEIFSGMAPGGAALLNKDNPHFTLLSKIAQHHGLTVFSFGKEANADFRLLSYEGGSENGFVEAEILGQKISYPLNVSGVHLAFNSVAVLGMVHLANADVLKAAESLQMFEALAGRGKSYKGPFTILDESYNANPTSMRAALDVLGKSEGKRKIAVIGHMVELGDASQKRHEDLLESILENKIDLVFCCGPHMIYLYEKLPQTLRGGYAPTSLELIPFVTQAVTAGDILSVKGSLSTRMKPIVEALLDVQKSFGINGEKGGNAHENALRVS